MSVPLSDTNPTEVEQLKTQLGGWIATNEQAKDNAARALTLLQRGKTDQVAALLRRMAGGEHELPAREGLLAEVDRLKAQVRAVETVKCWTNEDGRRFVFAEDLAFALGYTPTTAKES